MISSGSPSGSSATTEKEAEAVWDSVTGPLGEDRTEGAASVDTTDQVLATARSVEVTTTRSVCVPAAGAMRSKDGRPPDRGEPSHTQRYEMASPSASLATTLNLTLPLCGRVTSSAGWKVATGESSVELTCHEKDAAWPPAIAVAADGTLHLAQGDGTVERIAAREVISRQITPSSMMPEDLTASLTPEEVRDLLAFLMSLR